MAVELLCWFSREIRGDMPVVQVLGSSTIAQLGAGVAAKSEHLHGRDLVIGNFPALKTLDRFLPQFAAVIRQ